MSSKPYAGDVQAFLRKSNLGKVCTNILISTESCFIDYKYHTWFNIVGELKYPVDNIVEGAALLTAAYNTIKLYHNNVSPSNEGGMPNSYYKKSYLSKIFLSNPLTQQHAHIKKTCVLSKLFLRLLQNIISDFKNTSVSYMWTWMTRLPYQSLTLRMSLCKVLMSSKLPLSITEYTNRNPSPVCIYCSRMALNSYRVMHHK